MWPIWQRFCHLDARLKVVRSVTEILAHRRIAFGVWHPNGALTRPPQPNVEPVLDPIHADSDFFQQVMQTALRPK